MKKALAFFLGLAFLISNLSAAISETEQMDSFTDGYWEYLIQEDGTAVIAKYKGHESEVSVPTELNGKTVTGIGNEAFYECDFMKNITLPDSIASIGDKAFNYCEALKEIKIPNSVISIGANPFISCEKLTNIIISPDHPYLATIDGILFSKPDKRLICYPESFTAEEYTIPSGIKEIGDYAFFWNKSLKHITIPDTVTSIGRSAFAGGGLTEISIPDGVVTINENIFSQCSYLESIILPDSVNNIKDMAFFGCKSLANIVLPDGLTNIGNSAFAGCKMTEITIPDQVVFIGINPFRECALLTSIEISADHPCFSVIDGVLFSKSDKRLICYPETLTAEEYSIPDGTETIGACAFYKIENLKRILIPEITTCIEEAAFYDCKSLTTIEIPNGVPTIAASTFRDCEVLTEIVIPNSVTNIEGWAFSGCKALKSISIPDSVTNIEEYAFAGCDSLTIIVGRDSYAKKYCEEYEIAYAYPDSNDWLNE